MSHAPPLSNQTGYTKRLEYYNKHKTSPWQDWLVVDTVFDKPGKQGLVGLLSLKDKKEIQYVFKVSQYINYLAQHESVVMSGLNEMSAYCPHFCKSFGIISCEVDPKCRKEGNPFDIKTKYPIVKDVLLCEFIEKSCKFYNYIRALNKIHEDVLFSSVKQILMAISMAQKQKRFTHYDLHSFNIMMRKCDPDTVFLYVLDEGNQFVVPTHGHYPVIIDFGFSYIQNMDDGPLWTSLAHTDVGFMSDRFDWVADPKLFLVTVSGEIKEKRKSKNARKFRRIVRNMFSPLKIDWDAGWDDEESRSAADCVTEMVSEYNPGSVIFDEYEHYCIDVIQSLIILPLEEQSYSNIHKPYEVFVKEFVKIEKQISSPFYNLYILQGVVDAVRYVRAAYMAEDTCIDAVRVFRQRVSARVNEVAKFCRLGGVHFEKMICSLLVFSRSVEGVLYDVVSTRMSEKKRVYDKLPLQSVEQMYAAIEVNLSDHYTYNSKTSVVVLDPLKRTSDVLSLTQSQIDLINGLHPLCRGTTIYDIYSKKSPI